MADQKLTQLSVITVPADADLVYIVDDVAGTPASAGITRGDLLKVGSEIQAWSAVLDATTGTFLVADQTKLDGIEAGATEDQTGAEIKIAYEAESNTNAYTDTEKTKITGIESGADVTATNETSHSDVLVDGDIGSEVQAANQISGITSYAGTAETLALSDAGKLVKMNNAAANTLTVPPNSAVAFPVNTYTQPMQDGAGQTTIAAGVGVTIHTSETLKAAKQHALLGLLKIGTDEWLLTGEREVA